MSLAVVLGFSAAGRAGAQTGATLHPCSLLTKAQVTTAVGSVGESAEGDMPGTGQGEKPLRRACSWGIPGGLFTLSVGKVPKQNMNTRQLLDWMNSMYDMLKAQGWKYEKSDFGSTSCSLLTPPAGAAQGSPTTFCATVVKGMLVMTAASAKATIAPEKLKSVTEIAASRLP
ncbi:MAG: hypothetical protein AB1762_17220 [Gemmatimonadota bacterium]